MEIKFFLLGSATTIFIISISLLGFYLGKGSTETIPNEQPSPTPVTLIQDNTIKPTPITPTPIPVKDQIISAIVSRSYDSLLTFMSEEVSVRLEATECCGIIPKDDAIDQLDYLVDATGNWDFNNQEIIASLESTYPEHYGNAIIGISDNNYLVSIQLDEKGLISSISMSSNYKLLLP